MNAHKSMNRKNNYNESETLHDDITYCLYFYIYTIHFQAVSGNFVENLNSNVNMLNNKTGLCDNEIVDIDEENEIENNQLNEELRRGGSSTNMLVSQSFYTQERFKVLLGECVLLLIHVYLILIQNAYLLFFLLFHVILSASVLQRTFM